MEQITKIIKEKKSKEPAAVCVLMTSYNYSKYIIEALNSVKNQTFETLDIVVIDDSSTDNSLKKISRWFRNNNSRFNSFVILQNEKNQRVEYSRNTALTYVRSEFVFMMDSDNYIYPECISKLSKAILSSGKEFAYPIMERFGDAKGLVNLIPWTPELFQYTNYIDNMALFKKTAIEDVGGYTKMPVSGWEDYDLFVKFAEKKFSGCYVPEILSRYRVHGNSLTDGIIQANNIGILDTYIKEKHRSFFEVLGVEKSYQYDLIHNKSLKTANSDRGIKDFNITPLFGSILQRTKWLNSNSLFQKAINIFKNHGIKIFIKYLIQYIRFGRKSFSNQIISVRENPYLKDSNSTNFQKEEAMRTIQGLERKPKISIIVPVYNVEPIWLDQCIESVRTQWYENWELCLFDDASTKTETIDCLRKYEGVDPRIKIVFGSRNKHISAASNQAISFATGEFIGLLDNDDELTPDALYENILLLNKYPDTDFIYSDEDKIDVDGTYCSHFFKPDWSPDLFYTSNYLCHFSLMRKAIGDKIGWFREGYEGAQDFDLFLRITSETKKIKHIPKILYHWRKLPTSTSVSVNNKKYAHQAGLRAIKDHFQSQGINVQVEKGVGLSDYRIVYDVPQNHKVSIIIPFRDKVDLLKKSVKSILSKTSYENYEILLIDNRSREASTHNYLNIIKNTKNIRIFSRDVDFNYSAINNWAAKKADGSYLIFLNNDTEIISPRWIEEMLMYASQEGVGAVGALLYYPDKTIQHAGVILGLNGLAGHIFAGQRVEETYFNLASRVRNYLAVTAACMMISKEKFMNAGCFNEKFTVCGNDVDLCLTLYEKGLRNVYTPYAELYHHESATRDRMPPQCDIDISEIRYAPYIGNDPFYNSNFSLDSTKIMIREDYKKSSNTSTQIINDKLMQSVGSFFIHNASEKDINESILRMEKFSDTTKAIETVSWFIPDFEHVFYGGMYTILRFASYFQKNGIRNTIILYDNALYDSGVLRKRITDVFPELKSADFLVYQGDVENLPNSDVGIATFWTSAYLLLKNNNVKKKFYFIQDDEPSFYVPGEYAALAEQSYKFGFKGIVNTPGLSSYIEKNYGMDCKSFIPSIDPDIYYISDKEMDEKLKREKIKICFYGRPNTGRNGFDLAVASLVKIKEFFGDKVEIVSVGDNWKEEDYGVSGIIKNMGRLSSLKEVASLYRDSDIGLVFMFSKHPSYQPFEYMASGCAVVTNYNPHNLWFFKDNENSMLVMPTVDGVFNALKILIIDAQLRRKLAINGLETISKSSWDEQCSIIMNYLLE